MYYRLNCVLESGESRGYQWRELDSATFVAVATGTRPVGDAEAQTRDSPDFDTAAQNRTIYYGAVWVNGQGWAEPVDVITAEAMYLTCGQERAGA
jgi:hypothetical protein